MPSSPTPTPSANPRQAVLKMYEDDYRKHLQEQHFPGRASFEAKARGSEAPLTPQGRQYAIDTNPRFEHADPDVSQELATRGARARPEVAIPAGGRITPAQEQELQARLFHAPSHPDMPTPMRLFGTKQFASNPERGASNVADYRTMQHIEAARARSRAIPQPIAPKMAGESQALRAFGAL